MKRLSSHKAVAEYILGLRFCFVELLLVSENVI